MKHESIEQPTTLLRQIENVDFLLETTIPWMKANPDRVNFNQGNSECGTYGCVAGWYCMHRYGEKWNSAEISIDHDFGITNATTWCDVFGFSHRGDIYERTAAAEKHRATLQTQIDAWYSQRLVGVVG